MHFELNYSYHPHVSYKNNINSRFRFGSAEKLSTNLRELITIYLKNLYHAQKLENRAHDKNVKLRSYIYKKKIWLNSKYIKIKQNQKLKAKFFGLFYMLHLVRKQVHKIKLPKK